MRQNILYGNERLGGWKPKAGDAANESGAGSTVIDKASANRNGKDVSGHSAACESVSGRMYVTIDATVTWSVEKGGSHEFNSGVKLGKDLMIDLVARVERSGRADNDGSLEDIGRDEAHHDNGLKCSWKSGIGKEHSVSSLEVKAIDEAHRNNRLEVST